MMLNSDRFSSWDITLLHTLQREMIVQKLLFNAWINIRWAISTSLIYTTYQHGFNFFRDTLHPVFYWLCTCILNRCNMKCELFYYGEFFRSISCRILSILEHCFVFLICLSRKEIKVKKEVFKILDNKPNVNIFIRWLWLVEVSSSCVMFSVLREYDFVERFVYL